MDFSCCPGQETIPKPNQEFKGFDSVDDDEHFAELRRRILLLVADEDEENESFPSPRCSGPVKQYRESFNLFSGPFSKLPVGFNWVEKKGSTVSFPTIQSNPNTATGSGTGVFIPLANQIRRVHSGRMKTQKRKMYRRVEAK
ncbi:uncharacterized protein LOC116209867 [Punica granatum]|uniref:Uncharacterized protein LOC116209867 n=1 Tax=Punica granatum TaxID=22663 RepID=A0A6P8E3H2_PUNGR|nr:uncharacterized protein LOC116209867 [Punica granatum]